jgi:thymidylate kinase
LSGNEFKRASAAEPLPISHSSVGGDLATALELVHHDPPAMSVEPGLEEDDSSAAKSSFARRSPLLIGLLASFEAQKVGYCCWKSSLRAARGMTGASDLDLLIARPDRQKATELLLAFGFKQWPDASGSDHPAIVNFLGWDETTSLIHHVHIQFKLVFGHSLLKSFRLPAEDQFIARSVRHPTEPLRVLHPADEALLLVVRTQIESRWLDPIALRHRKKLCQKAANDLAALASIVERAAVREQAAKLFSPKLADEIADQLNLSGGEFWRRRISGRIARELSTYRMYGGAEAFLRMLARDTLWAVRAINRRYLRWPHPWRRRTPGSGVVISIVGLDGSGKSTLVREVRRWLGAEVDMMPCYFGTGDGEPSLFFRPFKAVSRWVARMVHTRPKGASHGVVSNRPPGLGYSVLFAVWAVVVAIEKRQKILATQRGAGRGLVVVTDRYPQNEIAEFNDGPLLHRLLRCPVWLRRFEASVYEMAQRARPDLLIKLQVGPETVVQREPQMVKSIIDQRIAWLNELTFSSTRVVSIDATRPLEEVHRNAKREIWSIL